MAKSSRPSDLEWAKVHWGDVHQGLERGYYYPLPVKRVGIPSLIDRVIQQAITQILQPIIDPDFSEQVITFVLIGLPIIFMSSSFEIMAPSL